MTVYTIFREPALRWLLTIRHCKRDHMDAIYIGATALLFALSWALAAGCGKLGEQ